MFQVTSNRRNRNGDGDGTATTTATASFGFGTNFEGDEFPVNVAEVEALFPQSSVAVKTTVMTCVQVPDHVPGVFDQVTLFPHRSEAEAPPLEASHAI